MLNALDIHTFLSFLPLWQNLLEKGKLRRQMVFAMKKVLQHVALLQNEKRAEVVGGRLKAWEEQNERLYELYELMAEKSGADRYGNTTSTGNTDGSRRGSNGRGGDGKEGIQFSNFHRDVSSTLTRMGVRHGNEVLIGNERVDIYIPNPTYDEGSERGGGGGRDGGVDKGDIRALLDRMCPPVRTKVKSQDHNGLEFSLPPHYKHGKQESGTEQVARGIVIEVNGPYHYESYDSQPIGPTGAHPGQ